MGTDIHVYLEERHKDGKWHCVGKNMYDGRDYKLFDMLTGVRYGNSEGSFLRLLKDSEL